MANRNAVMGSVLTLISLPLLLALAGAASFFVDNRSNGSFVSSGETRDFLVYVPSSYDRAQPAPLVISLHGAAMWGAAQKEMSQWNRVADAEGFIVVYPSGVAGNGPRIWREDGAERQARDVKFISELIDTLSARYNIDVARIYANGLSNGGGMSFALSCDLPDRIAAVGMVGAAQLMPFESCRDHRPFPMITFHGTDDRAVPYHGGKTWVAPNRFPDVRGWVSKWAQRNRCAPTPVDSTIATDVTRRVYMKCAEGADLVLYTIVGGGHTWPGGQPLPEWFTGRTTNSISASREMWAFFRAHPRAHKGRPASVDSLNR